MPFLRKKKKAAVTISRDNHTISRKNIDYDALKILYRLNRFGHTAYLVGGSVRDLLLNKEPKDFDISTSAHPNEIKKLFRNCFLIGKRFRLAHIRFGTKIIETSTFRRKPDEMTDADGKPVCLNKDNTFGTPEEDAERRDFTVNALFYDVKTFSIIDHTGGMKDLEKKIIRCIGDPEVRYQEDPVRMLRAVRFASRLDFTIEKKTLKAIHKHASDIMNAPPSRLAEDMFKLFSFGSAEKSFTLLHKTGLLHHLLPEIHDYLKANGRASSDLWSYLRALDVSDTFKGNPPQELMLATLFAAPFFDMIKKNNIPPVPEVYRDAAKSLISPFAQRYNVPKRILHSAEFILAMQVRFAPDAKKSSPYRLFAQDRFPLVLELLAIQAEIIPSRKKLLKQWQDRYKSWQTEHPAEAQEASKSDRSAPRKKRRYPRKRNRRSKPQE